MQLAALLQAAPVRGDLADGWQPAGRLSGPLPNRRPEHCSWQFVGSRPTVGPPTHPVPSEPRRTSLKWNLLTSAAILGAADPSARWLADWPDSLRSRSEREI